MRYIKKMIVFFLFVYLSISLTQNTVQASNGMPFRDVSVNDWYYESVDYVYENGLMTGMQNDVFGPAVDMSRAMVVTVLWRMEGMPTTEYQAVFKDVSSGEWYTEPVLWANANGIVTGYNNGMFGPADNITREQIATMLYRYAKYKGLNTSIETDFSSFKDADKVSEWAVSSMKWAVGAKLMQGMDAVILDPAGYASRAQVATLLMRFSTSKVLHNIETSTGYAICDLELDSDQNEIHVVVSTKDASILSLEVADEQDVHSFFQTQTELDPNLQIEDVKIALPDTISLPENFIIKAKLLDREDNLLCDTFVCRKYTDAYRRFSAKQETDYPEERLLDLADKHDGNFAVIQDDVIHVGQTGSANTVISNTDGEYIFENPDIEFKNLNVGDKICFLDRDGQYVALKIQKITVLNDNRTLIQQAEDSNLADFYETIKINTPLVGVPEGSVAGIALYSEDNISQREYLTDIEMGTAVSNTINTDFGSVEHKTSVGGKLELNYDVVLFGEDYLEFVMTVGVKSELGFVLGANKKVSDEIEIVSIPLVGLKNIAEIPAELSLSYDIDAKAGASTNISIEAATGCVYNSYDGSQKVEYKTVTLGETEIKGEIKASIGPKVSVNAELFDEAIKASIGAESGIGINGTASAFTAPLPGADSYHACDLCVDGTVQGYFEVEITADYDICDKLEGSFMDLDLLRAEWNLGRFYCSLINEKESVHKGDVVFAFGTCPNAKYKAVFYTYKNKDELPGCSINIKNDEGTSVASGTSVYTAYFYPGNYSAHAVIDNRSASEEFVIANNPATVTLTVKDYYLRGVIKDETTHELLGGVSVTVKKDGEIIANTASDSNGFYEVILTESGSYEVVCSKSGYDDKVSGVLLAENEVYPLNVELKPSLCKVTIEVICFGEPEAKAVIQGKGLPEELVADRYGRVTVELPPGEYTLIARGKGYYGKEFVVVDKDMTVTIDLHYSTQALPPDFFD